MYLLVLVLVSTISPWTEPKELYGDKPYSSLEQCVEAGYISSNWLAQDHQVLRFRCVKQGDTK